jgi:hypothetical protein
MHQPYYLIKAGRTMNEVIRFYFTMLFAWKQWGFANSTEQLQISIADCYTPPTLKFVLTVFLIFLMDF